MFTAVKKQVFDCGTLPLKLCLGLEAVHETFNKQRVNEFILYYPVAQMSSCMVCSHKCARMGASALKNEIFSVISKSHNIQGVLL